MFRSKKPDSLRPDAVSTEGEAEASRRNMLQKHKESDMKASKQEKEQPSLPAVQYLTFLTAGEEYAVNIGKVKEIVKYDAVTTVPNTPSWIRGVTNLRGAVVPVVDLAVKFGFTDSRISKFSCIIIVEVLFQGEKLTMGVLSDSVSQVIELSADDIEETPPFGTRVKTEYLLGMGPLGKKFCLILDIDKVLSADEILAVTESANNEAPIPDTMNAPQSAQRRQAGIGS